MRRLVSLAIAVGFLSAVESQRLSAMPWDQPPSGLTIVHCGTLLARPGEAPITGASIVIEGDRIVEVKKGFVTEVSNAPGVANGKPRIIDLRDSFVLPGLIDCHTHITFAMVQSTEGRLRNVEESDADAAIRGVVNAKRTLEAGFTTIRNVGSSGDSAFAVRDAIAAGKIPGPRILEAGESISPTGGHSDSTHGYREDLMAIPGAMQGIADGADACRAAVRAQVKRGADVIKLTATGGVLSATAAGTEQQFFEDELEAIVETAHLLGRKVAAHAHGAAGIKAALKAGVDSIEHGTFLDDEAISLFKQKGAYLVPTILAGVTVAECAEIEGYFKPMVAEKARAVGPVIQGAFGRAYKAGVQIAFGTDSGVSEHGKNAREFELMVQAGMPAMEAIKSATVNAAQLIGLSETIGMIEAGKQADVIAVKKNPLEDIRALQDVSFVMRGGVVWKERGANQSSE
ncbi:MAG: amidohydrolase family protein [Phycisphaerales bacterium]|nr:amidohydrolase family protein [Phycisphaerales bacterium]